MYVVIKSKSNLTCQKLEKHNGTESHARCSPVSNGLKREKREREKRKVTQNTQNVVIECELNMSGLNLLTVKSK